MKSDSFTLEEQQLIVESLLFAAGTDICAEWTPKQIHTMLQLGKKINNENIKLNSIYLFEGGMFDQPEVAEFLIKEFPNLPRTNIISD